MQLNIIFYTCKHYIIFRKFIKSNLFGNYKQFLHIFPISIEFSVKNLDEYSFILLNNILRRSQ